MNQANRLPLVVVDIGNTRVKFGLFPGSMSSPLPEPERTLSVSNLDDNFARLTEWLGFAPADARWVVASVNRPASSRLIDWLRERKAQDQTRLLASFDLPLTVALPRPDMVGIDRLAGAVGANQLRKADRPACVVDLGTAIKVDVISAKGEFLGGAILPGIGLSARALHEFTDLLPLLDMEALTEAPPAIGTATVPAMQAGLYWGAIGAAKELIAQVRDTLGSEPQILLTGGAAASVATHFGPTATYVRHLVLGGIALAADRLSD